MTDANPTCREIERDLVAMAAGEAASGAARVVERHLARCRGCRDELERPVEDEELSQGNRPDF